VFAYPHQREAHLRIVLLAHHDAPLHVDGIARWLGSWATLAGVVVIHEPRQVLWRRLRREWQRIGAVRLLDVLAFRVFYRLQLASRDSVWLARKLDELRATYPVVEPPAPRVDVASPNSAESRDFIAAAKPDIIVALCKNILAERIFSLARCGTVVFHPGICPEYRNSHGCFWALASNDLDRVGMTVLRIDKGIDTGPVLGYFRANYDGASDSHITIQHQMVLDNLDGIREVVTRFCEGSIKPVDVSGRASREWGQPWLTAYLRWKSRARRRTGATDRA
jgi:hypothetical protein